MRLQLVCAGAAALMAACVAGCPAPENDGVVPTEALTAEPDEVTVDHILVGVTHDRNPGLQRTPLEATALAAEIHGRLTDGGDWDALKAEHSNDRPAADKPAGGPYTMVNDGVPADPAAGRLQRRAMASAFGDVGFSLKVGEIGVAAYHVVHSPFGVHIIKRVK